MKFNRFITALLLASVTIGGCGKDKANPTKDYAGLNVGERHDSKDVDQSYLPGGLFIFDLQGDNPKNEPVFTAGEPGIAEFQIYQTTPKIKSFVVIPRSWPAGSSFVKSTTKPNIWVLTWTPPVTLVDQDSGQGQSELIVDTEVEHADIKWYEKKYKRFTQTIRVSPSKLHPEYVGHSLPPSIDQGKGVDFTIDVRELATSVGPALEPEAYEQSVGVADYIADGSTFVNKVSATPEVIKGNIFRYKYHFETAGHDISFPLDKNNVPVTSAKGLKVCFNVKPRSRVSGNAGGRQPICTMIKYQPKAPVINFGDESEAMVVQANTMNRFSFMAYTPDQRGSLIVTPAENPESWSPPAKLNCVSNVKNPSVVKCDFEWNLTGLCNVPSPQFLKLNATTSLGEAGSKTTERVRKLVVEKPSETCAHPAAKLKSGKAAGTKKAPVPVASPAAVATPAPTATPAVTSTPKDGGKKK